MGCMLLPGTASALGSGGGARGASLAAGLGLHRALLVQDAERLLQGLDLLLALRHPLLVAHPRVDARRLELDELLERLVEECLLLVEVLKVFGDRIHRLRLLSLTVRAAALLRAQGHLRGRLKLEELGSCLL